MKKLILFILLTAVSVYPDMIYLPPGSCMTVPSGSIVCADTLYVDTNACFIGGDSNVICSTMVIRGGGSIVISVDPISTEIPNEFSLSQNYPNPFNPVTNIQFDVSKTSLIKLVVYDMLGRETAVLVYEELKPGTYKTDWDGSNYPSGVYYYKLTAGDFAETKKMVLIK